MKKVFWLDIYLKEMVERGCAYEAAYNIRRGWPFECDGKTVSCGKIDGLAIRDEWCEITNKKKRVFDIVAFIEDCKGTEMDGLVASLKNGWPMRIDGAKVYDGVVLDPLNERPIGIVEEWTKEVDEDRADNAVPIVDANCLPENKAFDCPEYEECEEDEEEGA